MMVYRYKHKFFSFYGHVRPKENYLKCKNIIEKKYTTIETLQWFLLGFILTNIILCNW